jgi:hypothetical protein
MFQKFIILNILLSSFIYSAQVLNKGDWDSSRQNCLAEEIKNFYLKTDAAKSVTMEGIEVFSNRPAFGVVIYDAIIDGKNIRGAATLNWVEVSYYDFKLGQTVDGDCSYSGDGKCDCYIYTTNRILKYPVVGFELNESTPSKRKLGFMFEGSNLSGTYPKYLFSK